MKKYMVFGAFLCAAVAFTGCKSSENAYRKAYERAKAQEQTVVVEQPVVTPVTTRPAQETVVQDNYENERVRQESLTVVNGAGLSAYNVVVGSFSVRANADRLQSSLRQSGYNAQVAYNSSNNMYRVVATSHNSKGEAVQSRNRLQGQYPDAWLLYNVR